MHMNRLRVRERERGASLTKIIWTDSNQAGCHRAQMAVTSSLVFLQPDQCKTDWMVGPN